MPPKKKFRSEEGETAVVLCLWQYESDTQPDVWNNFNFADSDILDTNFQSKNLHFETTKMSFSKSKKMAYDLQKGVQTNPETGSKRGIRRLPAPAWRWKDDHGVFAQYYDEDNAFLENSWRTKIYNPSVTAEEDGTKKAAVPSSFQTTALSFNVGFDSKYTFSFEAWDPKLLGIVNGAQKNEESGNERKIQRIQPPPLDVKGWGISSKAAMTKLKEAEDEVLSGGPKKATVAEDGSGKKEGKEGGGKKPKKEEAEVVAKAPKVAMDMSILDPPSNWVEQKKSYELFPVAPNSAEFKEATSEFLTTLQQKATIHSVTRIQNTMLWRFYALTRYRVGLRNKGGNPNEMLLFHGARMKENMDAIQEFGFDMRVAASGSVGTGIYFAPHSQYSNGGYVLRHPDNSREIFVCRVAVGSHCQGKYGQNRPLPKPGNGNELYDSVHNGQPISMYVVYENTQAYPQYIIHYTPSNKWG